MTLDEFEVELRETVEEFLAGYRKEHEQEPDLWPLEQEAGDWWEQFQLCDFGGDDA